MVVIRVRIRIRARVGFRVVDVDPALVPGGRDDADRDHADGECAEVVASRSSCGGGASTAVDPAAALAAATAATDAARMSSACRTSTLRITRAATAA